MSNRIRFTTDAIRGLPAGPKRQYFYDTIEKGLCVSVTPAGTKSFFYYGRIHGRPERVPVGRFPDTTIEKAKESVMIVRLAIAENRDPREAVAVAGRKRGTGVLLLSDFWEVFLDEHAKKKRSRWKDDAVAFKNHFKPLAGLPLGSITPERVRSWHNRLGTSSGKTSANKQVDLLRAIFAKAMVWNDVDGRPFATMNPAGAALVTRFEETGRDRFLQADELGRFLTVLAETETPGARHFFQLALWTGARKQNLMKMDFGDLDRESWIWTIPREQFKGMRGKKHPHPVPIVSYAEHVLRARKEMLRSGWVFPGRRANGKPIGNVDFWWNQIRSKAEVEDLRIHDLRRTIASWMAMTGASYPIIAQFLGHTLPGATQIYARLAVEPVRQAVQIAADKIMEVAGVEAE